MGWIDADPVHGKTKAIQQAPVSLSAGVLRGGRFRMTLAVRSALEPALDWFAPGRKVNVQFGDGADAGKMRIVPAEAGLFRLTCFGSRKVIQTPLLLITPEGIRPGSQMPEPLAYTVDTAELVVVLPKWARPSGAADAVPVAAAREKPTDRALKPFSMLGGSVR